MAVKVIETLSRPNTSISWKNPVKIDDWITARVNEESSETGLISHESSIGESGLEWVEITIYEDVESMIKTHAYHPSLTELRQDQNTYRTSVGITQTLTLIDTNTGNEIPSSMIEDKKAQLRASGFDPCLP